MELVGGEGDQEGVSGGGGGGKGENQHQHGGEAEETEEVCDNVVCTIILYLRCHREGKPQIIEEDNPVLFKKAVGILTMKLFADLGMKYEV